jgi:hypothetical protein
MAKPASTNPWFKPVLTAIVILAMACALALAASFVIGRQAVPATDRSDDQIEAQRDATLSAVTARNEAIEKAAAAKARAMSGVPADTSYEAIQKLRGQSGVTVDTSYEAIEKARAAGPWSGSSLDAGSFDRKYQELEARGQHGQLR